MKSIALYGRSLQYIWQHNKGYLLSKTFLAVINMLRPFPGIYLASVTLDLLTSRSAEFDYVKAVLLLFLSILLIELLHLFFSNRCEREEKSFDRTVSGEIASACMDIPYEAISRNDVLEQMDRALTALNRGALIQQITSIGDMITNAVALIGMITIALQVHVILLIPFAISVGIKLLSDYFEQNRNYVMENSDRPHWRRLRYIFSLAADFSFAKEIRLFGMREGLSRKMKEATDKSEAIAKKLYGYSRLLAIAAVFSDIILEGALYFYLGYQVLVAKAITVGRFSLLANAVREVRNRTSKIIADFIQLKVNSIYMKDFFAFLDFCSVSDPAGQGKELHTTEENISLSFENVGFTYPGSNQSALKNINIKLKAGDKLLIVGENGAGKSTFIKLLTRLYDPTAGRILLNGVDIREIQYEEYQNLFAPVFQENPMMAFTLAENITAFHVPSDAQRLQKAVGMAEFEMAYDLPKGLDTMISKRFDESGVELSGGEQQKAALARAYYKQNAQVFLLDEPTSAMDAKAEYRFYQGIDRVVAHNLCVFISHRMSSAKLCSKIIYLENGQVEELGNHELLMAQKGKYYSLFELQAQYYQEQEHAKQDQRN